MLQPVGNPGRTRHSLCLTALGQATALPVVLPLLLRCGGQAIVMLGVLHGPKRRRASTLRHFARLCGRVRCLKEWLFPQLDSAHVLAEQHIGHGWNPNDPADIW